MVIFDIKNNLCNLFHLDSIKYSEVLYGVTIFFETTKENIPSFNDIFSLISQISQRDKIELIVDLDVEEPLILIYPNNTTTEEQYNNFVHNLITDDTIHFKIEINKKCFDNTLSIYNIDSFNKFLFNKSLLEMMRLFSNILDNKTRIQFQVHDKTEYLLITTTIVFSHSNFHTDNSTRNRIDLLSLIKDTSNFYNFSEYKLIPNDFQIIIQNSDSIYVNRFHQIETLLSMIYLSNISYIDHDVINLQLIGHLTKQYAYSIENNFKINNIIIKIFYWAINNGNQVDKINIARNIISLHCRISDFISIDDKTYSSIQSNFNLYLKNSVSQYLELKKKLSDFLSESTTKLGTLLVNFSDGLKGNVIAYITFIIAVYLTNIVKTNTPLNIFTNDVTLLTYWIILGSFGYLIISIIQFKYQIKTVESSYEIMKLEYSTIFEEDDIKSLFNDDKVIITSKKKANNDLSTIIFIWLLVLVILFYISSSQNNWECLSRLFIPILHNINGFSISDPVIINNITIY